MSGCGGDGLTGRESDSGAWKWALHGIGSLDVHVPRMKRLNHDE